VNDPKTGYSPFPGNINQLLFKLKPYAEALLRTKGAMPEFVNPKYADESKTIFKKPTRLECMMQDFPNILSGEASKHVGFTSIPAELCFSPVKNATADGVSLQANGTAPGVAATGEADQYAAIRKIMKSIGCLIEDSPKATFNGITVIPGPEIVVKPSFAVCPAEYKSRFPVPSNIKISGRSSLVVEGNIVIESLDLDGALIIRCEEGATGTIRGLVVDNKGWNKVSDTSDNSPEYIRIRGYRISKEETKVILFKKDGSVDGYVPPQVVDQVAAASFRKAPDTPKQEECEQSNVFPSPPLKQALAVDTQVVQDRNLNLHEPRTPEASVKHAECCVIT
jgi:UDP-sugar pyrophosphorylase